MRIPAAVLAIAAVRCDHPNVLPMLYAQGSLYQVGSAVGEQFGPQIRTKIASPGVQSLLSFVQTPQGAAAYASMRAAVVSSPQFSPFLDELAGMADYAGVLPETLLVMQMADELGTLSGVHEDHCSDILLPHSINGSGILAHNEDGGVVNYGLTYLVSASVEASSGAPAHSFTAYCYPGELPVGAFAFTSTGLVLTTNGLFPDSVNTSAIPRQFIGRYLLTLATPTDVLDFVTNASIAEGFSLNMAWTRDPSRQWNVELGSGGQFSVLQVPRGSVSFHFNEYLRLDVPQQPDPSSEHRMTRALQLPTPTSVSTAWRILGDTLDPVYPIYRNGTAPDQYATLATATFVISADPARDSQLLIQLNNPISATPLVTLPIVAPARSK